MDSSWKLKPESSRDCLIVEDDLAVMDTLTMYCENLGIFRHIIAAHDGQQASVKLRNQSFALILIDINIPKKNGIALLDDFNNVSNQNEISNVAIVSGEIDKEKLTEAISKGVKSFVTKPFDEETFRKKIKIALPLA